MSAINIDSNQNKRSIELAESDLLSKQGCFYRRGLWIKKEIGRGRELQNNR